MDNLLDRIILIKEALNHNLSIENDNLYMTISTDSKEVKFEFSKVEFINIK